MSTPKQPSDGRSPEVFIGLDENWAAHNYHPLDIVVASAEGAWVTDVNGKRYVDMLAAYSALNFGHRHPVLTAAAAAQLGLVTLTSRAVRNDRLGPFAESLAELAGKDMVLPMNTGAEAVETAIKTARKWGYEVKGVAPGKAKVLVCSGNFHGRTTTIISFSGDDSARDGFGPFTPGFQTVAYGDAAALEAAIDDDTVAFLFEPVQGEAGVIVPPDGWLRQVREICTKHQVLMMADEIQSGLGRTGYTFACDHEGVVPDVYILGKALGGGIIPVSAVVADHDVLGVFTAGTHGSTFGGNPLGCAIGSAVVGLLRTGEYQERSRVLGAHMLEVMEHAALPTVRTVRGRGLWAGIDIATDVVPARTISERLALAGVLAKETHARTVRLAPTLVISRADLDWALERILEVLAGAATGA
jgi:ornithine--oxo-acid transaminase